MYAKSVSHISRVPWKLKIVLRIPMTDISDDPADKTHVVWQFSVFHPTAQEVAQNASEILMARIRNQTAGVREHADETSEHARIPERPELALHAVPLVIEPPGCAKLDLARHAPILKASGHGAQGIQVFPVQTVQDGFRQTAFERHRIQQARERHRDAVVAHGVEPGVRTDCTEHDRVVVPLRQHVKLHGPTEVGVFFSEMDEQPAAITPNLNRFGS